MKGIDMNNPQTITRDRFCKRLAELCLRSGMPDFPKDNLDRQILLKSAALLVGNTGALYNEKEINEKLQLWLLKVCQIPHFDHVTLRRYLVDAGYLLRSSDGGQYQVVQPGGLAPLFEPDVEQLDVIKVIQDAREEIARRKREYMEKSHKG
jgi:hypothetical protein